MFVLNSLHRPSLRHMFQRGFTICGVTVCALLTACATPSSSPDVARALSREAGLPLPLIKPVIACADLATQDLTAIGGPGSRIVRASLASRNGKEVCSIEGVLAPTIGFKVTLPTNAWTQRLLQVGCGGLCGRIPEEAGAAQGCGPLEDGSFAMAGTDMGHSGMDADFGDDPRKRIDFAYRAVHLTAVAAKALVQAFYGQPQRYAYFTGCSDGGREALMEAQRYPDDFDGIIAGAPALNFQAQNAIYHAWQARANTGPDGRPILLANRLPLLHSAVLRQCDGLDGRVDSVVALPQACRFDPATIQCPATGTASRADCLNASEVAAVRRLYDGPRDPSSGMRLTVGGPLPGSELGWAGVFVPRDANGRIFSEMVARQALQKLSYEHNPAAGYTLADTEFTLEAFDRLRPMHKLYDATNPDLERFAAAGHKLILWHGLGDPHISPLNTVAYHQALVDTMGNARVAEFERFYLIPGMHHCAGGEGLTGIDMLSPMMEWVERGKAPQKIVAYPESRREGAGSFGAPVALPPGEGARQASASREGAAADGAKSAMLAESQVRFAAAPAAAGEQQGSRPVYPYPMVAVYDGQGDPTHFSSYRPGIPPMPLVAPEWAGSDFFRAQ